MPSVNKGKKVSIEQGVTHDAERIRICDSSCLKKW